MNAADIIEPSNGQALSCRVSPAAGNRRQGLDDLAERFVQWVQVRRATGPESLSVLAGRFMDWLRLRKSENTVAAYEAALDLFLEFAQGRGVVSPADVEHQAVEEWLGWLKGKGASNRSVNARLAALRSFWKWMRRGGYTIDDPAGDCVRLKQTKLLPKYLRVPDQEKLLCGLRKREGDTARRDEAMVATALLTGLRCGELVELQMEELDLDGGILRVMGKGSKERELPIVPRLAKILRIYVEGARVRLLNGVESRWVFVSASSRRLKRRHYEDRNTPRPLGEPLGRHSFNARMRKLSEEILGRRVKPHALRHSFASRLRSKGADLLLIQEALGHSDVSTTAIYAHLASDERREKLSGMLG